MTPSSQSQTRTITAFFDDRTNAEEAVDRLHSAGLSRDAVRMMAGHERSSERDVNRDSSRGAYQNDEGMGFWDSLKDLFLPDEDRHTYAEGLRRGGYLVTVRATEANYARALDILDDEGTIDLDEREASWRSEGWTGYTGPDYRPGTIGSAGMGASSSTTTGGGSAGPDAAASTSSAARTSALGQAPSSRQGEQEEVIPVAEEELRVGKRDVSGGRVRVRSYVVETPVQEQVSLREEHVSVERRPVDRAATTGDNLFRERTIETEERAEEAVVSKEARVKEELVLKKGVEHRTETVSDKVRKTEVEVEDERGQALRSGERKTTR
jgi:uncharacterized protein (TIGR02271 family)